MENTVEPDRLQITLWYMCTACWKPKATDTHSEYVILIAFPLQQLLHECASVLCLYVHCLACLCSFAGNAAKLYASTSLIKSPALISLLSRHGAHLYTSVRDFYRMPGKGT